MAAGEGGDNSVTPVNFNHFCEISAAYSKCGSAEAADRRLSLRWRAPLRQPRAPLRQRARALRSLLFPPSRDRRRRCLMLREVDWARSWAIAIPLTRRHP